MGECSSLVFERFAKRAGIHLTVCPSLAELKDNVKQKQSKNFHRPLAVIADDAWLLREIKALPLSGRTPFLVDASSAERSLADAQLLASCLRRWDIYKTPLLEALPRAGHCGG
ncbi:unnamed protein product [Effrenium voratum]|nr:unnamed protein product [Effrenium voratum]